MPVPASLAGLGPDDWTRFVDLAIRLRVAGPVLDRLRLGERRGLAPEPCLERLKAVRRRTLAANLHQQAGLNRVLKACAAADIPAILLKGLWVTEMAYRDLSARSAADIDLWFRPRDLPRFTQVARELGFEVPAGVADLREIAPATNEFPLVHVSQGTSLDVHWGLTCPGVEAAIDEEAFWRRAEWVTLAGRPCRSLCLEDHLLYLCFHAADHHHFMHVGPRALLDVARLIGAPPRPLDWDDVVARARGLGWSRGIWLLLDLAREHVGARPPPAVLDALRPADAGDPVIRGAALAALFDGQRMGESLAPNLIRLAGETAARGRAVLIWTRLFPPREYIATYFRTTTDDARLPWLYVRRLGLLFGQHGPKICQLLFGDRRRAAELERARVIARWLER